MTAPSQSQSYLMPNAADMLRQKECERRIYRTDSDFLGKIEPLAQWFCDKYPGNRQPKHYCELVSGRYGKGSYDFAVRHMIRWGRADARLIEDAFQISLPPFIHEFYSQVQEAVLVWRNIIHILPPEEVIAWERQNREWEGKGNGPVRLVRFIKSYSVSGDIAIRRSVSDDKWRMFYVSVDDEANYEEARLDHYTLAEDLDSWLQYLMTNDGAYSQDEFHQSEAAYLMTRVT